MTMMDLSVDAPCEDDAIDDVPRSRFLWLGWAVIALGFAALAGGIGLGLAAFAEPARADVADFEETVLDAPPLVAIVIDDVGLDRAAAERAIALPAPISLALLPYAESAAEIDAAARAAGHETLIHVPMEPVGLADPGPDALMTWLPQGAIVARLDAALARAPGASGLNNHMGSRFTRCARCVADVAAFARAHGAAVAIGHPHAATLDALEAWAPQAEARGVTLARASEVIARRAGG